MWMVLLIQKSEIFPKMRLIYDTTNFGVLPFVYKYL